MSSTILGQPLASGPQIIVSGNPWSGTLSNFGGVQIRLAGNASGNAYVGCSGNITMLSGGMFLSGGGTNDGMLLRPGDGYFFPKLRFQLSGTFNVFAWHDATCSGQARLFYDVE